MAKKREDGEAGGEEGRSPERDVDRDESEKRP